MVFLKLKQHSMTLTTSRPPLSLNKHLFEIITRFLSSLISSRARGEVKPPLLMSDDRKLTKLEEVLRLDEHVLSPAYISIHRSLESYAF